MSHEEPPEELWIPLVDEPIGGLVARIQEEDPELDDPELTREPEREPSREIVIVQRSIKH